MQEAVYRVELRLLIARQPYEVDVALESRLYPAGGIEVVHVAIHDSLEHHPRMVGAATALIVQLVEIIQLQTVNHSVNNAHGVVFRNIFVDSLRKKYDLFGIIIAKV